LNIWDTLAIKATPDQRAIKRAYAAKLKITRPEDDPQAYQELREAFDAAKRIAKQMALESEQQEPSEDETHSATEPDPESAEQTTVTAQESLQDSLSTDTHKSDPENEQQDQVTPEHRSKIISATSDETVDLQSGGDEQQSQSIEQIQTKSDDEAIDERARELVQSVHDELKDKGEVAAVAHFQELLKSNDLLSIDLAKRFDARMMGYLEWWAQGREQDKDLHLPLGFMRQVINHFQWHLESSSMLKESHSLERLYESIIKDCGVGYLTHLDPEDIALAPEKKWAAKTLVGPYRPKYFKYSSIISSRRNAIYDMLDTIKSMNDASFDFELNTETVKWWEESRNRVLLSGWMILVGMCLGLILTMTVAESLLMYPELRAKLDFPYAGVIAFYILSELSYRAIFGSVYVYDKLSKSLEKWGASLTGRQEEVALGGIAALIFLVACLVFGYLTPNNFTCFFIASISLWLLYKKRAIALIIGCAALILGFHLDGTKLMLDALSPYQIIFPILTVNTALFYGYLDFKAKQLNRDYRIVEILPNLRIGLGALLIATCFAYSLIVL